MEKWGVFMGVIMFNVSYHQLRIDISGFHMK